MFRPAAPSAVEIWPTMFGTFSFAIADARSAGRARSAASGKFTEWRIVAVLEKVAQRVGHHDRAVLLGLVASTRRGAAARSTLG